MHRHENRYGKRDSGGDTTFAVVLSRLVDRHKIGNQLARHRACGAIAVVAALDDVGMQLRELRVPTRRQLCRFYQYGLQVRIALFGKRGAFVLPSRFVAAAAKSTVALNFLQIGESCRVVDLERPEKQGRNRGQSPISTL